MKNKEILNKTPILDFGDSKVMMKQKKIDKDMIIISNLNRVLNNVPFFESVSVCCDRQRRNVFCLFKKAFLLCMLLGIIMIPFATKAQSLRLAIGSYECLSNEQCSDGYCDIESHKCCQFPVCPECDADKCKDYCPALPVCQTGEHLLDGQCVECVRASDCSGATPYCNPDTNQCESCPDEFPKWTGTMCGCADGMHLLDGQCISTLCECKTHSECTNSDLPLCNTETFQCQACPSEKPYWDETLGECTCPLDKPYWNEKESQCEICPDLGTYDRTKQKCVIIISESGFEACPWGPAPGCSIAAGKFGPYTHSYNVLVSGQVDDEIRFYVNSTNIYSAYNTWCSDINGYVHGKNAYGSSLTDYEMGQLNAGDFGHILIFSSGGCIYWKNPGKIWLELID